MAAANRIDPKAALEVGWFLDAKRSGVQILSNDGANPQVHMANAEEYKDLQGALAIKRDLLLRWDIIKDYNVQQFVESIAEKYNLNRNDAEVLVDEMELLEHSMRVSQNMKAAVKAEMTRPLQEPVVLPEGSAVKEVSDALGDLTPQIQGMLQALPETSVAGFKDLLQPQFLQSALVKAQDLMQKEGEMPGNQVMDPNMLQLWGLVNGLFEGVQQELGNVPEANRLLGPMNKLVKQMNDQIKPKDKPNQPD